MCRFGCTNSASGSFVIPKTKVSSLIKFTACYLFQYCLSLLFSILSPQSLKRYVLDLLILSSIPFNLTFIICISLFILVSFLIISLPLSSS